VETKQQLQERVAELKTDKGALTDIVLASVSRTIEVNNEINTRATAETKAMNNSSDRSDSSRKIEIGSVGGDFNASGSALNLGDISGTVTNTLNQLSGSPDQQHLKDYLTELLDAIQTDPALSEDDRLDAQEAVNEIGQAAQAEQSEPQQSAIAKASRTLNRMAKALPDATKFVRSVNRLLPLIVGLI